MTSPSKGDRSVPLDINTTRSDTVSDMPAIAAYAFSSGGALLDVQPIDEKGNARLALPVSSDGDAVRIVLGPQMEKDELTVSELLRRGGLDAHVAVRPNIERLDPVQFDLTSDLIRPWLGRRCVVKGTLLKRTISGGITVDLPVCNATVDIWEVDPWPRIIFQLPDLEINRLRDVIDGPWPPINWPIPPRPPIDDYRVVNPGVNPGVVDPIGPVALNPQPLPPRFTAQSIATPSVSAQSVSAQSMTMRSAAPANAAMHLVAPAQLNLPADLQIATRGGRASFERAVIANIDLLRPILCWLYPRRVTRTKIATVMTDECGHFRTVIWRSIFNTDVPDLYFTARQRFFFGFWITIYEPTPVACNTWWDYQCGTEVTLITTNPFAHTCPPCRPIDAPPNWVLFMAIGNTSVAGIHGANDATKIGAPGFDLGRYGLLGGTRPFGGTLLPRLEFDNALRGALGVRYYRISYKRPTDPDTAWQYSTANVGRHYIHTAGTDVVITPYPLGPNPVNGTPYLYEIPPALPPEGQWSLPNVVADTENAEIPTTAFMPAAGYDTAGNPIGTDHSGRMQIRVELFDINGAMIDPEALGIAWRVPGDTDLSGTIHTVDAATLGLVDTARNCMTVTVHVDNNPCFASIGAPTVDGSAASDNCGVMRYIADTQTVVTPYTGVHRNGFATTSFFVRRGEGTTNLIAQGPLPSATSPAGMPAAPSASVATLLGPCNLAGFLEYAGVSFTGTDGWSDLHSGYDASALRAFVLAPQTEVTLTPIS